MFRCLLKAGPQWPFLGAQTCANGIVAPFSAERVRRCRRDTVVCTESPHKEKAKHATIIPGARLQTRGAGKTAHGWAGGRPRRLAARLVTTDVFRPTRANCPTKCLLMTIGDDNNAPNGRQPRQKCSPTASGDATYASIAVPGRVLRRHRRGRQTACLSGAALFPARA